MVLSQATMLSTPIIKSGSDIVAVSVAVQPFPSVTFITYSPTLKL